MNKLNHKQTIYGVEDCSLTGMPTIIRNEHGSYPAFIIESESPVSSVRIELEYQSAINLRAMLSEFIESHKHHNRL